MDIREDSPVAKPVLLIVDDNVFDQTLYSQLLLQQRRFLDYTIVGKDSCSAALDYIEKIRPACCLVDYQMPGATGLDFLKAIRRSESGESIPIIIMTAGGDEKVAVEMMRNGAQDYLVKQDINLDNLSRSITNAMYTCELQNKLRKLAHYDHLTGLLNRSLFMDRLQNAVEHCDRYGQSCSLLFIDVDNFKQINDRYGHDIGDILLKATADRIRENCRATDSAARLGGDEFAVLLTHISEADTYTTAEKILKKISEPVFLDKQSIHVSLSIGVAHYPDTAGNIHDLLRQADEAMYNAKKAGKANYFHFTQEQKQQWERRQQLEKILPQALEKNELTLAYQPIMDTKTGKLRSLEVLVRWFPENYIVPAPEIIEIIERLSLFDVFHIWLINAALKQLSKWREDNPELQISLNIPANQCHSDLVVECLQKALTIYNVQPDQVEIEITENTLMKHPAMSTRLLKNVQQQGISVAVDDFGTGYSSMAYLTSLPLNTLKIDQHFFIQMENDDRNRKVVEAVTALGHSLGLNVVAEGVETQSQYRLAQATGCDLVQGFYFGKPQLAKDSWREFCAQFDHLSRQPDSILPVHKTA